MSIIHCLFWIKNNTVSSLICQEDGIHIMKFKGKKCVPFTCTFWDDWIEYSGMCQDDKTDFCIIYDDKPILNDILSGKQCDRKDAVWSRNKIASAVGLLKIKEPTEIHEENGILLLKTGYFMNIKKEDIISMTALYLKVDEDKNKSAMSPKNETTLIKHYEGELRLYKKGYEK